MRYEGILTKEDNPIYSLSELKNKEGIIVCGKGPIFKIFDIQGKKIHFFEGMFDNCINLAIE